MANQDEALLKEVDQDLADERQWAAFRKYGPALIGASAAIVVGVGGYQIWQGQKTGKAERLALEYRSAVELLAEDPAAGRAALEAVSTEGGGYGVLAQFYRAGSFASNGERLNAIAAYRDIYQNAGDKRLRELARLRAAYLSLEDGREAVLNDLGDLTTVTTINGVHAREVEAVAAMLEKDYETAHSLFRQLSIDLAAPESVQRRAEGFAAMASAGKAGVNIFGETRVDELIEAVGAATSPDGESLMPSEGAEAHSEDDGHNHGSAGEPDNTAVDAPGEGELSEPEQASE